MKFTYLYVALSLVLTSAFSEVRAAPVKVATAAISKIDGDGVAKVRRKSGTETVAGTKQELFPGDRITTDSRSTVELMLSDGTLVRVGFNSEYRLESVNRKGGIFTWVFGLAKGSIRALVEKNPQKKIVKFRVNTPVGTMGVRGTELVLDHNEKLKRTTLHTIEGRVEFGAKGCPLRRDCIEVKTGETASVGGGPGEQRPVVKKSNAAALFLLDPSNEGESASAIEASQDERLARAALFSDVKNAERFLEKNIGSILAKNKGSVEDALRAASEAMAAAQDELIGRTAEERKRTHRAIDDGSYQGKLKLAEKFNEIQTGKKKTKSESESENLSAAKVQKKLNLAEAILKSKKMKSAIAKSVAGGELDATIAEGNRNMEALKRAGAKVTAETTSETEAVGSGAPSSGGNPDGTDSGTGAGSDEDSDEGDGDADEALEVLDKSLVDALLKDETVTLASETYTYEEEDCFLFFCEMETKTRTKATETLNTKIERKSGICYETKQNCKRQMIPCDLSKGKSCKPTFTDNVCTNTTVQVTCPAVSDSGGHHHHKGKGKGKKNYHKKW